MKIMSNFPNTKYLPQKTTALLGFMLLLLVTPKSWAAKSIDECTKKRADDSEYSRCLDSVKEYIDRELQTWVNNQTFILEEFSVKTGRKSALNMFKRSQGNFIKYREDNCRWQYLAMSPGLMASPAYKECYIRITQTRIKELTLVSEK